MPSRLAVALALAGAAFAAAPGCSCGHQRLERAYPAPTAASIVEALAARRARARSFNHAGTMEFWSDGDRVKTGVLVMGRAGSRVRLQALDPAGGMVMADLACDGAAFTFVDFQHECQLTGPCSEDSIAALLRVRMTPDDLVLLALGQPPALSGEVKGTVSWDPSRGAEVVDLLAADGRKQLLVLDGRRGPTWDVVEARAWTADGKVEWVLSQKDFVELAGPDGGVLRAGRKLRFEQPETKGDLGVDWDERAMNPTLDDDRFRLAVPTGLKECPRKAGPVTPAPLPPSATAPG